MSQIPSITPISIDQALCVRCGYSLAGLREEGVCPECGTPVSQSLRGLLLVFSAPEYVAKVHKGVYLVQAAIIASIIITILGILIGFLGAGVGWGAGGTFAVQQVTNAITLGIAGVSLYGWWLFSEPDPGYAGRDPGDRTRAWVRNLVIASAAAAAFSLVVGLLAGEKMTPNTPGGMANLLASLVSGGVWIASFFVQMTYLRWLSPRLPDAWVAARAKRYLWLLPVLYVVLFVVLMIGPLIALILYYNLLDRVRKNILRIRQSQGQGLGPTNPLP